MAETHVADPVTDMDYPEHERTYRLFTGLIKYGMAAVIVIILLMAYFLI
jgi:hypothetical protein